MLHRLLHRRLLHRLHRARPALIRQRGQQRALVPTAEGRVERADRARRGVGLQRAAHLTLRQPGACPVQLGVDLLLARRLTGGVVGDRPGAADGVDARDHVRGHADHAPVLVDAARDRLPDPPVRVRAEAPALGRLELLRRSDQPDGAVLHEVLQRHPAPLELEGHGDDEAQVGLNQPIPRGPLPLQLQMQLVGRRVAIHVREAERARPLAGGRGLAEGTLEILPHGRPPPELTHISGDVELLILPKQLVLGEPS
mmetsp:Transcript_8701/g.20531  ORF Transcript_8701/g.20531 Transcript_8701/m.20531 type:complete len:255 (-) Transcript_8701:195-959(-)